MSHANELDRIASNSRIDKVWPYFGLAQILPISFTQNLFCLHLLFLRHQPRLDTRNEDQSHPPKPPSIPSGASSPPPSRLRTTITIALPLGYVFLISRVLPSLLPLGREKWLIPTILLTRFLLLIPYMLYRFGTFRYPSFSGSGSASSPASASKHRQGEGGDDWIFWGIFIPLAAADMLSQTAQLAEGKGLVSGLGIGDVLGRLWSALSPGNSGSAVAALAWDVVIAFGSLIVCAAMGVFGTGGD